MSASVRFTTPVNGRSAIRSRVRRLGRYTTRMRLGERRRPNNPLRDLCRDARSYLQCRKYLKELVPGFFDQAAGENLPGPSDHPQFRRDLNEALQCVYGKIGAKGNQ